MVQQYPPLTRRLTLFFIAFSLSACSVTTLNEPPLHAPQESQPTQPPKPVPPPVRFFRLSPAGRALVTQARTQLAHDELPAASLTLDRALRIEPNNPLLWIELGRLRLAEGDAHQAEGCGRKALALASGDRGAQALAGRVLADALRAQQRNQEARDVESPHFSPPH